MRPDLTKEGCVRKVSRETLKFGNSVDLQTDF